MTSYCRQDINQDDIDMVSEVLRSDFLTQGPIYQALRDSDQKKMIDILHTMFK